MPREKKNHLLSSWMCHYIHTWPGCLNIYPWVLPSPALFMKPSVTKTGLSLQPWLVQKALYTCMKQIGTDWVCTNAWDSADRPLEVVSSIPLFFQHLPLHFLFLACCSKKRSHRLLYPAWPFTTFNNCVSLQVLWKSASQDILKVIHAHCTSGPY